MTTYRNRYDNGDIGPTWPTREDADWAADATLTVKGHVRLELIVEDTDTDGQQALDVGAS